MLEKGNWRRMSEPKKKKIPWLRLRSQWNHAEYGDGGKRGRTREGGQEIEVNRGSGYLRVNATLVRMQRFTSQLLVNHVLASKPRLFSPAGI
jgi:hypothetical protein